MKEPQQFPHKSLKLVLGLAIFLPFLVASYTCQLLCSTLAERILTFGAVFLFAFLIFWIVVRTIVQLLDE